VVTFGVFVLVYLAAWIVIPEEREGASIAGNLIKRRVAARRARTDNSRGARW
jgi:hypothetical protein